MKKLIYSVALLTLLCACGNPSSSANSVAPTSSLESIAPGESSSSMSPSGSSSSSSSAPSSLNSENASSKTQSSSPSTTPIPPKTPLELALEKLQTGYSLRSKYSRCETTETPTKYQYFEVGLGNKSATVTEYKNEEYTETKTATFYQKAPDNLFSEAYYAMNGKVNYTPIEIKDPLLNENVTWEWEDMFFENAFTNLTIEDFTQNEDKSYSIIISDEKMSDAKFAKSLQNLRTQLFPLTDNYGDTIFFVEQKLISFSFEIDETGTPTTFSAEYEKEKKYSWEETLVQRKVTGSFTAFGEDIIEPLQDKASTLTELDTAINSLKANNYEAHIQKDNAGDGFWSDPYTACKADLVSDGKTFEYAATKNSGWGADTYENQGFINVDESHYREYTFDADKNYTYLTDAASPLDGQVSSLFPSFDITGAFMLKDEEASTETKKVYKWNKPTYMKDLDIALFTNFDNLITGIAKDEFTITLESDTITFKAVAGLYTSVVTYSNIGNVSSLNRVIAEPAAE